MMRAAQVLLLLVIAPLAVLARYEVCVTGRVAKFGKTSGRYPSGIKVFKNGRCKIMEFAGNTDGYLNAEAGDGHEDEFDAAVAQMLGETGAIIGVSAGRNNPANKRVNRFLAELLAMAKPVDVDDGGVMANADVKTRRKNVRKLSRACSKLIRVKQCKKKTTRSRDTYRRGRRGRAGRASLKNKYKVCVKGKKAKFGITDGKFPSGIVVKANGKCRVLEYAGNTDGYLNAEAGDGHEDEFDQAVADMLGERHAVIGIKAGRNNPRNKRVNEFLSDLLTLAKPVDVDDGGVMANADVKTRRANIRKLTRACTKLISVQKC